MVCNLFLHFVIKYEIFSIFVKKILYSMEMKKVGQSMAIGWLAVMDIVDIVPMVQHKCYLQFKKSDRRCTLKK